MDGNGVVVKGNGVIMRRGVQQVEGDGRFNRDCGAEKILFLIHPDRLCWR